MPRNLHRPTLVLAVLSYFAISSCWLLSQRRMTLRCRP